MSNNTLSKVKAMLLTKFLETDETELCNIEKWISSASYKEGLREQKQLMKSEVMLKDIATSIKTMFSTETKINKNKYPSNHQKSIYDDFSEKENDKEIYCIDQFLYNEEDVEEFIKNKTINYYYCCKCNSRNIEELIYVSHSMSRKSLQYIFKVLLPSNLELKQIMDVGSRIGAVIFAAYELTNAKSIVGIEINKELCEIQEKVIDKFSMEKDRIKIVHNDVMDRQDLVAEVDIMIINVLDFFVDNEKHKEMWYFFKKNIKNGSYIVTNRSICDTLISLGIYEEFSEWINICSPCQLENKTLFCDDEFKIDDLHLYKVM